MESLRSPSPSQSLGKLALAFVVVGFALGLGSVAAKGPIDQAGPPTVERATLPSQARQTDVLIHQGGTFPYAKDGSVFGNRERLLPTSPRGYYREYTVKTPGASDRGARRIVCGGKQATRPEACYYTGDHYTSFARIVQ